MKLSVFKPSFLLSVTMVAFVASFVPVSHVFAASEANTNETKAVEPASSEETVVDKKNPYKMIKTVAGLTFKRFALQSNDIKENPNLLKDVVAEELMPYVNHQYSAYKVIGKHLKNTSKEDRKAFVPVFLDYLITSYAQVFTLYDNQEVLFSPEKDFAGKGIIAIKTEIVMPGGENIDVSFKVRIDKKTKEWKAFDMVAEGVSLLDSKQAELGPLIRQKGLPYVTEMLKEKSQRDIVFKNDKG
ncbi:MAG: MlaC/ttg2D family ABC transporter substrate-binding protein [Colwellia sp.]